jgi:hypothetical protein
MRTANITVKDRTYQIGLQAFLVVWIDGNWEPFEEFGTDALDNIEDLQDELLSWQPGALEESLTRAVAMQILFRRDPTEDD